MTVRSLSPHDQSVIGEIPSTTPAGVVAAVEAARSTQNEWRRLHIDDKVKVISIYRMAVAARRDELANLMSREVGKPYQQCLDEIDLELTYLDYYVAHGPNHLSDETVLSDSSGDYRTIHEPYGVVACIAPWNFPLAMFNSGVVPALIAGNAVVFKPSEHCTLSQQLTAELLQSSGLPEGVLGVVTGDGQIGKALVDSPVDLVWFTGSTRTGREIYRKCGERFIKAICEMGGSSPAIVFADADLSSSIEKLYWSRFLANGQVCNAVKRLYVERSIYQDVIDRLVARLDSSIIGDPLEAVDFGPLVSPSQLEVLQSQFNDAINKGAQVEFGGEKPTDPLLSSGNYFAPTIITNISSDMRVITEETFGPLLPIIPFDTESEVVTAANNTTYGLSAEIYTADIDRAERVGSRLQAGTVAINTSDYFKPELPFGGYKLSGMGREYGRVGMQEFAQLKLLAIGKS